MCTCVTGTRDYSIAIGRKCDRGDEVCVPLQLHRLLACPCVPHPHWFVVGTRGNALFIIYYLEIKFRECEVFWSLKLKWTMDVGKKNERTTKHIYSNCWRWHHYNVFLSQATFWTKASSNAVRTSAESKTGRDAKPWAVPKKLITITQDDFSENRV